MEPTVITVREPREMLAFIPYQLGFVPEESFVAVSLRRPRGTAGLVVRVDLADLAGGSQGAMVASSVRRHLLADGAHRVFAVVYTADRAAVRTPGSVPAQALEAFLEALAPALDVDVWWVGPTGYGGIDCEDPACCPEGGRPLTDLESTQVGAAMVVAGAAVAATRDGLRLRHRAAGGARRSASRAATAEQARRRAATQADRDPAARDAWADRAREGWARLCRSAEAGQSLPPSALGRALASLEDVVLRDEVLTAFAIGPALGRPGLDVDSGAEAMFGSGAARPDRDAMFPLLTVLEATVAHASGRRAAPALAMLACLSWWLGDGARASVLAEQCLSLDPKYRLALLVADALRRGVPPGWARSDARRPNRSGRAEDSRRFVA